MANTTFKARHGLNAANLLTTNSTVVLVGANVSMNTTAYAIGNTTANVDVKSTWIKVANASGTANLSPTQLLMGANVNLGLTSLIIGNTIANAVINSLALVLANATLTKVLTVGTALVTNATANLQVGFTSSTANAGVKSSSTYTPNMQLGQIQNYFNNGAHTLAPPSDTGSMVLDMENQASAGVVTTSGFTKVSGDSLTTTSGHKFRFFISVGHSGSHLYKQAMQ